jgi:DNA-binding transcriptional regulator YdaS (Cro superfamily)
MKTRDHGLKTALREAGSLTGLARGLGIKPQSIIKWTRVPAERCVEVERLTGVPREVLRPDLFAVPRRGNVRVHAVA